LIIVKMFAH